MARDNFSKPTTEILAKRVSFVCSNPKCRCHTIGPNAKDEKVANIGVAAHITAASPGGPRYDSQLTPAERSHINNGIWLCTNCSVLIDKDPDNYTKEILLEWKMQAEEEMKKKIGEKQIEKKIKKRPIIEGDLLRNFSGRNNDGFSKKNKEKFGNEPIPAGGQNQPIIHWILVWDYTLVLMNNSTEPAFNIKIEYIEGERFVDIDKLEKINNLPPLQDMNLRAIYKEGMESTAQETDPLIKKYIAPKLEGTKLRIKYFDTDRNEYSSIFIINQEGIETTIV